MMRKRVHLGAALLLCITVSQADASILTFDDYTPLNSQPTPTFDYGGLTFSFSDVGFGPGYFASVWSSSPNTNGTPGVIAGFGTTTTITRTGGGVFDLNSLDAVISWFSGQTSFGLSVNGGAPIAISNTMASYQLNLLGVGSVELSGLPDGYWAFDNLDVEFSAIPVPAALPLLASGLGALGFAGWRRNQKNTLAA